jgi:hypothetical protein
MSAPTTMHALTIDPLLLMADCEVVVSKAFSSLSEQYQPECATEETQER